MEGKSANGAFYGMQTFIQLLRIEKNTTLNIPAVWINDQSGFAYRGAMRGVRCHFPLFYLSRNIDCLALHMLNYFYWHLTEDQGWRIENKKYTNLTKTDA